MSYHDIVMQGVPFFLHTIRQGHLFFLNICDTCDQSLPDQYIIFLNTEESQQRICAQTFYNTTTRH